MFDFAIVGAGVSGLCLRTLFFADLQRETKSRDERAGEVIRLIASLPTLPFVRAAVRWLGHRLGLSARPALPPRDPPPARTS